MQDFDYSQLDEGIRHVVKWLHKHGFTTTDSGDGTKEDMECAWDKPMVVIKLEEDLVNFVLYAHSDADFISKNFPEWTVELSFNYRNQVLDGMYIVMYLEEADE